MSRLRNARIFLRNYGLWQFAREMGHQFSNACYERYLGIRTAERVALSDIGINRSDSRDSMPIGYRAFYSAFRKIPLRKSDIIFLDFGVGQGRAICAAATLSLKRIIGVELSKLLVDSAQANLSRMKHRKTREIDIRQGDATSFALPNDVNVIYFFNPFFGDTLQKVVENIHSSYAESPRKMYVIYFNNDHFDKAIYRESWIRKIKQKNFYPRISCGIYETVKNAA